MKKYNKERVPDQIIVNEKTGEVVSAVIKTTCYSPEDFIKLYLDSIDDLIGLNPRLLQVLLICVKHSTFSKMNGLEGNFFSNNKILKANCKQVIKSKEELTDGAIDVYLHRLTELKVILRYCRGTYVLNPKYFFKGTITKKSRMQLIATYEGNLQD
ncbi:MAG: hypothetical protein II630_03255 [Bacteroidales bacterium]|nr:hypothetical protein [Bacteroidales bacterium]